MFADGWNLPEWTAPYVIWAIGHMSHIAFAGVVALAFLYALKSWLNGWRYRKGPFA
jgi:hypothetical protein